MLTLEEINPYLPYKLKVMDTVNKKTKLMNLGDGSSTNWVGLKTVIRYSEIYKPLLFPLSYLDQEITVNVETFCPIQLLQNEKYPIDYFLDNTEAVTYFHSWYKSNDKDHHVKFLPKGLVDQLIKWKLDVFGLIDQGKAINVLEIDKNIYR